VYTTEMIARFSLEVEDRILVSRQSGPFDMAYAMRYAPEAGRASARLDATGPYAFLIIYSGLITCSQDAKEFFLRRTKVIYAHKRNCVAIAIVAPPGTRGFQTLRPSIEDYLEASARPNGNTRLFDDADLARTWLREKLAQARSAIAKSPKTMSVSNAHRRVQC